jgi:hypothetical protein
LGLVLAIVLPLAAGACSDILDVHVPGRVQEEALDDPALAPTMVASVVADFECAWNNYVAAAALIGDEFIQASGNLNQRNWGSRRITADDPNDGAGHLPHAVRPSTPPCRRLASRPTMRSIGWTSSRMRRWRTAHSSRRR